jgi:hypothetical protein
MTHETNTLFSIRRKGAAMTPRNLRQLATLRAREAQAAREALDLVRRGVDRRLLILDFGKDGPTALDLANPEKPYRLHRSVT